MIDIKSISKKQSKLNNLKWTMTTWCNYKCPYCIQEDKKGLIKFQSEEELIQEAIEINKAIETSPKDVRLYLIGGEVTYFNLINILSYITSSKLKEINITTNLSNTLNTYLNLKEYLNSRNIKLNLYASLHESQIKDLEEFYYKATQVATKVSLVVNDSNLDRVKVLVDQLIEHNIKPLIDIDRTINKQSPRYEEVLKYLEVINANQKTASPWNVEVEDSVLNMSNSELKTFLNRNNCIFIYKYKCHASPRYRNKTWYIGGCDGALEFKDSDISKIWEASMTCNLNKICSLCSVENIIKVKE